LSTGVLQVLACPQCRTPVDEHDERLSCPDCRREFSHFAGVWDLRPHDAGAKPEQNDWSAHWSDGMQASASQRFFSFYRKAVFSRTVRHYLHKHFAAEGVFVEAGSGTSETSMRVAKHDGARTLVAVDIVLPVLAQCHPVMDVRLGGDIFRLPFLDGSLDGIWNVGVMEHFTAPQIDAILREFHRVLKPAAPLILLWPGVDSIPQRMLRTLEFFINLRREERFRFHPDEISQLRSLRAGRGILTNNGFDVREVGFGLRSMFAFKVLVGEKPRSHSTTLFDRRHVAAGT
jgi:SAM-dependent methyltransferase